MTIHELITRIEVLNPLWWLLLGYIGCILAVAGVEPLCRWLDRRRAMREVLRECKPFAERGSQFSARLDWARGRDLDEEFRQARDRG